MLFGYQKTTIMDPWTALLIGLSFGCGELVVDSKLSLILNHISAPLMQNRSRYKSHSESN